MKRWRDLLAIGAIAICGAVLVNEVCTPRPDWPNAVMAVVAVLALLGAVLQIQESKRSAATAIYADYLKLAIENPQYARPSGSSGLEQAYDDKYSFYVSFLLLAAEEILEIQHGDIEWEVTLKTQLMYHRTFLCEHKELYAERGGKSVPMYSQRLISFFEEARRDT